MVTEKRPGARMREGKQAMNEERTNATVGNTGFGEASLAFA